MPKMIEMHRRLKDQGLVLIGIHTKSRGEQMADYAKEVGIEFPIAVDVDGETVKAFAVDSYPDYYLIDRAGNVRVADLANADLERAVTVLLAEPDPTKTVEKGEHGEHGEHGERHEHGEHGESGESGEHGEKKKKEPEKAKKIGSGG